MDELQRLGIRIGQPESLIITSKDTVGELIEKGQANGVNAPIGFRGNAADRLQTTISQNSYVSKSMRKYIGKSEGDEQYSKGDDNKDGFGSDNLKDTHGEQFHEDKHVSRKEVDNDKAEATDRVHATEEESYRGTKKIVKQPVHKEKETTSGDGLVKRSMTQEELFLKALGDLTKSEEPMNDDEMPDIKKKKCMSPKSMKKGPIVDWAKQEEQEEAHKTKKSSDFMDDLFGKSLFPKKAEPMVYEPYKPSPDAMKSSLCSQFSWKIKELQEFKNSSWFMERELDDAAKSMAEKMYSKMKSEINAIVKKYDDIGKSYAEVDQLCNTLMKSTEACGAMLGQKKKKPMKKSQGTYDILDSLIEMVEDRNDPDMIANVHENSNELGRLERPTEYKSNVPFLKSAGKGGFVFDFGPLTGNPIADKATILLNRHGDPTQIQIAKDQASAYQHSMNSFIKSGATEEEAGAGAGIHDAWTKSMNTPMDQQVVEAFKSGALDNTSDPSNPAVKNHFNKSSIQLGGMDIKATSPTDAALIEMMKAEMANQESPDMLIADARNGGAQSVTIDARTGNVA